MDKKSAIMKAAEKLFTTRPFHAVTIEAVAVAAKVGKGTIYKHFADKDDLFFHVVTSGPDELCELLQKKIPEEAPFESQLLDMCTAISDFFRKRHQLFRLMQAQDARMQLCKGNMRNRHMENRRKLVNAVGEVLAKGVRKSILRNDIPTSVLADALIALLWSRAHALEDASQNIPPLEVVIDLFCSGASHPKPAAPPSAGDTP